MTFDAVFWHSLNVMMPLFFMIGGGCAYAVWRAQRGAKDGDIGNALNAINLDVFLPMLIFWSLARADGGNILYLILLVLSGTLIMSGSGLISLYVCRWLKMPTMETVPSMMFVNYGNMGLPLIVLAFGEDALTEAVALFIAGNMMHLTLGFKMLDKTMPVSAIVKAPMFVAAAAGLAFNISGLPMPAPAATALEMAAGVAIPLMLFALGMRLRGVTKQMLRESFVAALLCPLSGLICFAIIAPIVPLDTRHLGILALFSVLPPALLNYMFAEKFGLDTQRVASIVTAGNLFALVLIPPFLMLVFFVGARYGLAMP